MSRENLEPRYPSTALTAAGITHAMLTYRYRDAGDLDGYGSLLDEGVEVAEPGAPRCRGRGEVLRSEAGAAGRRGRHRLRRVVAEGDTIVVVGRLSAPDGGTAEDGPEGVDFVDVFTLSDAALILDCRRYYHAEPWARPARA
jgi:hypothetical protein